MNKGKFNLQNYLIIIGVVIILFISFTKIVSPVVILPLLGGICLAYGIITLVTGLRQEDRSSLDAVLSRAILQICLGGFVFFIGIVEALQLQLPQGAWYLFFILIAAIIALWGFLRTRNR